MLVAGPVFNTTETRQSGHTCNANTWEVEGQFEAISKTQMEVLKPKNNQQNKAHLPRLADRQSWLFLIAVRIVHLEHK